MERPVSRLELARELGVEPQTIAKRERQGWFPKRRLIVSDRLILYERDPIEMALRKRRSKVRPVGSAPGKREPSRRRRRASNKRADFKYFPDTGDAYFEIYEPGTRLKRPLTLHDIASKEEAEKLCDAFRAKVKRRAKRAHMIATTLREFFDEYFEDISAQARICSSPNRSHPRDRSRNCRARRRTSAFSSPTASTT